jgi:hypothetical protein
MLERVPTVGVAEIMKILGLGVSEDLDPLVGEEIDVPGQGETGAMEITLGHLAVRRPYAVVYGNDRDPHCLAQLADHELHRDRLFLKGLGTVHAETRSDLSVSSEAESYQGHWTTAVPPPPVSAPASGIWGTSRALVRRSAARRGRFWKAVVSVGGVLNSTRRSCRRGPSFRIASTEEEREWGPR